MRYIVCIFMIGITIPCAAETIVRKLTLSPITQNNFGTSIDGAMKFYHDRNKFSVGVGYLINPPEKAILPNAIYTGKGYASTFLEHFVLKVGHEMDILSVQHDNARLFVFTEYAAAKTILKSEDYSNPLGNPSYFEDSMLVYEYNYVYDWPKTIFLTAATGLGFEVPITDKLSLQVRGGASVAIMLVKYSPKDIYSFNNNSYHMFYSFSINYEL